MSDKEWQIDDIIYILYMYYIQYYRKNRRKWKQVAVNFVFIIFSVGPKESTFASIAYKFKEWVVTSNFQSMTLDIYAHKQIFSSILKLTICYWQISKPFPHKSPLEIVFIFVIKQETVWKSKKRLIYSLLLA